MRFHLIRGKHQLEARQALTDGFNRHGAIELGPNAVACWGWRGARNFRRHGHDVLVLERGYIGDRLRYSSIGWNGLNGRAVFPEYPDDGGRRFRSIGVPMMPWDPTGDSVLLVGQVPGDMSIRGKNLVPWYEKTARLAEEVYGLPVRFRPHPVAIRRNRIHQVKGCETDMGELAPSIERAAAVVTFNSNTGVESVLAGKPTVCHDPGSMSWPIAAHELGGKCGRNREQWAHELAWKQWTLDEIRSGEALVQIVEQLRDGRFGSYTRRRRANHRENESVVR